MKPTIVTKLTHQLTLTPQLQQAIRLLQLSTLELRHEIDAAIELNPLLEYTENDTEEPIEQEDLSSIEPQSHDESQEITLDKLSEESSSDVQWDDVFQPPPSSKAAEPPNYELQSAATKSLHDHLQWQMRLTHFSETDLLIAEMLIDAINDDGFLTCSLEEIKSNFEKQAITIDLEEIIAVLHQIQNFDPTGVAARDLRECLLLQLQQLPKDTPYLFEATSIINDHLQTLAHHDYRGLIKVSKLTEEQLHAVIKLVQSLNPKPGNIINSNPTEYVIPDVIVTKQGPAWTAEINTDALPKIGINQRYSKLVSDTNHKHEHRFLQSHLQDARWFIKSLQNRNETLLKVANAIIEHQHEFLERGEEAMRPLILQNIADNLGLHESTVSRITTQKYILTPRGVFELKYFFSSHLTTEDGSECSSIAIRALMKRLISSEEATHPLSDNQIAQLLAEQGIQVARRTVAKYREEMQIAPSHERKGLK